MSIYDNMFGLAQQQASQMDYYNHMMRAAQQSHSILTTNGTGTVSQPAQSTRAVIHKDDTESQPKTNKKLLLLKR